MLAWYAAHRRVLPWREDPRPYHVWISEMMLQQTQVKTVLPYFDRFIRAFPTVEAFAAADLQTVLKLWEGLGYYARVRNMHKAAQVVVSDWNGELPADYIALQTLPGVGPYTAAAITSIAFNQPHPVVDGNVLRVFARFWGVDDDIRGTKVQTSFVDRLTPVIEPVQDRSAFNQAVMELGALVCGPRRAECDACPLRPECVARRTDRVGELPFKSPSKPVPHYDIAVAVILDQGNVLIARREESKMLGGLWEFPGGKQESGEALAGTAVRETREETGLDVEIVTTLCTVKHAYSHFRITLTAFVCTVRGGTLCIPRPFAWVGLDELDRYPFPKANTRVIAALLAWDAKKETGAGWR
ncbi:MAG: A/G-specific adenine glycosylase [Lentisphaerae bacterium]|nr:A/G-specific adenine glycosylase [Lentisphaerota bacterium]MBT4822170.1 A/G-specific adenine glycosylase [Lentisphaerota bacterium]MBT5612209.1 A/G-specific adenine glycosylase [Lentisphaerota bacterium]MBT7061136.1 A/G-specific adenine glycosylase [Lentisphaerota bacterium]